MTAKNYLKRFMVWVINSKNNLFLWTRLKLTFLYITFIAAILITFSAGLYLNIDKNVRDNIDDKIKGKAAQQKAVLQTDIQLKEEFVVGDIVLLFISAGLAFFMAGKNLRPIQRAMEKQKRFTADASHDLRTPLAIMKMDCEVSLKKKDIREKEFRELAKSNLEEVNRMSLMVEQLLFLSRNNEIIKQETVPVSLGIFTDRIVARIKLLAVRKNITLGISESQAGEINGNKLDLEKMLFNVIKNAIDYTLAGGKIDVAIRRIKNQMEINVKDSGVGIAAEDLLYITEPFYKADKVRTAESGGSGLGLSIVKEIIEKHHGKLIINSQPGAGTEISMIFPIISA